MAEERDIERSEPASPRRVERAREEGQVARSPELATFAIFSAALAVAGLWSGEIAVRCARMLQSALAAAGQPAGGSAVLARLADSALEAATAFAPLFALLATAGVLGSLALGGWIFTTKRLWLDFRRLDPAAGLARIFSVSGAVSLARALAKTALIGGAAAAVLWHYREALLTLASATPSTASSALSAIAFVCAAAITVATAIVAALDVPYQRWHYLKELRMSRDELRRELKETEGDPHLRARIRAIQRRLSRSRMMAEVPKADVVVTNPTHYAVALRYREREMHAPRVVAKGCDRLAERIRETARAHGVPLVEQPALARALYRHAEVGEEIPEQLYTAVAEVLAAVYRLREATHRARHPRGEVR